MNHSLPPAPGLAAQARLVSDMGFPNTVDHKDLARSPIQQINKQTKIIQPGRYLPSGAFIHPSTMMDHLKALGNVLDTGDRTTDHRPVRAELTLSWGRSPLSRQRDRSTGRKK